MSICMYVWTSEVLPIKAEGVVNLFTSVWYSSAGESASGGSCVTQGRTISTLLSPVRKHNVFDI
jgi:hypothetical protein